MRYSDNHRPAFRRHLFSTAALVCSAASSSCSSGAPPDGASAVPFGPTTCASQCPPDAAAYSWGGTSQGTGCSKTVGGVEIEHGPKREVGQDGRLLAEECWKEGKKHGPFKKWSWDTGKLELESYYFEDELSGPYYSRGVARGGYRGGLEDGDWQSLGALDRVEQQGAFALGKRVGPWTGFWAGHVRWKAEYVDGQLHGKWQAFDADSRLVEEGQYEKGRREGAWRRWIHAADGSSVVVSGTFQSGGLVAPVTVTAPDGRSLSPQAIAEPDGPLWVAERGAIIVSGSIVNGVRDGTWLSFDDHGVLSSQARFRQGLLDGTLESFDANGNLASTATFSEGKLVKRSWVQASPLDLQARRQYDKLAYPLLKRLVTCGSAVLLETEGGHLRAWSRRLTDELWSRKLAAAIVGTPRCVSTSVLLSLADGATLLLDASTGALLHRMQAGPEVPLAVVTRYEEGRWALTLILAQGRHVKAVDAKDVSHVLWKLETESDVVPALSGVSSEGLWLYDGTGKLLVVDDDDGTINRTVPLAGRPTAAAFSSFAAFVESEGNADSAAGTDAGAAAGADAPAAAGAAGAAGAAATAPATAAESDAKSQGGGKGGRRVQRLDARLAQVTWSSPVLTEPATLTVNEAGVTVAAGQLIYYWQNGEAVDGEPARVELPKGYRALAVGGRHVIAASRTEPSRLAALSLPEGKVLWSHAITLGSGCRAPVVLGLEGDGDASFLGCEGRPDLYSVSINELGQARKTDAEEAETLWRQSFTDPPAWSVLAQGLLLFADDDSFAALDPLSGRALWTWRNWGSPQKLEARLSGTSVLVLPGTEASPAALTRASVLTGRPLWVSHSPEKTELDQPEVAEGLIAVMGLQPKQEGQESKEESARPALVSVLDATSGWPLWQREMRSTGGLRLAVDRVVAVDAKGLGAYALRDGKPLWHYDTTAKRFRAPLAVNRDAVFAAEDGVVRALALADGKPLWASPALCPESKCTFSRFVADDTLLWVATRGAGGEERIALDAKNGAVKKRAPGRLAVVAGHVIAAAAGQRQELELHREGDLVWGWSSEKGLSARRARSK